MINELYRLGDVINSAGILTDDWHRQLKELRKISEKTPFFKILISKTSSIYSIEEITDKELLTKLRKWETSYGHSFPAFNMPNLFSFSKEQFLQKDDWLSGKKPFNITLLKSWCTKEVNNWDKKALAKLEKCLHVVPNELKQKIDKDNQIKNNSILELVRLLENISVENFRETLKKYVFEKLDKQENVKTILRFLFSGKPEEKIPGKQNIQANDVQIILDLANWELYDNPVVNEKSIKWLNSILIKSDQATIKQPEGLTKQDAFGYEYFEIKESMPSVKLAGKVGEVKLRSMFREHQCQLRYRLIDDGSYPINKANRGKIKAALEWLKEPDKEGKTWGMVDSEEIIFAYPSKIPKMPLKLASLLGTSDASNEPRSKLKFESIAKDVIDTLNGLPPENKVDNIQIFAIRKMDKARSKIVFYRGYTTERLILSAKKWREGCTNIPSISFKIWLVKTENEVKAKSENIHPAIPMPLQIAKIMNKIWKMNGAITGEIKRVKYYQGLELLLERDGSELAIQLLNILVTNIHGLIIFLGNLLHSGKAINERFLQENYLFFPSVIGLLLYKQNRLKENYVKDIPYLVGQILKISDELHAFYCKIVRKNNIPPQLVGNSLMVSALETPERALAQLAQRINPYIAWAKQYRSKDYEESWRAAWYLSLFERNMSLVKNQFDALHGTRLGDREKAELFIGYLADFPKKETVDNIKEN